MLLVLEGGRGGGQPASIYSSQESSRSEALQLYKLIGKPPLEKRKRKYRRGENVEQAFTKYPGLQHNNLHPPDQVVYLCFSFSPHQEGEEAVGVKKV